MLAVNPANFRTDFDTLGYTRVDNVVAPADLSRLQKNLTHVWDAAKRGEIPHIRVYEDYPRILGGLNVAGIEDPFHYAPSLKEWIRTSGFEHYLEQVTGWPGAELELARIHTNDRFKYQGFWHRDARIDEAEESVIAAIYFEPEAGFRVAPAESRWSLRTQSLGDEIQQRHYQGSLEGEQIISAPAGAAFFFKSYLLHRGYCSKPRIHLHLRFVKSAQYDPERWSQYRHETPAFDKNSTSALDRMRELVRYCLPLPNRSSIFQA